MSFDLLTLLLLAFGVIGTIEWFKVLLSGIAERKAGAVGLALLSLVSSFVVAVAASVGDFSKAFALTFILLATVQLLYQLVIQTVSGLIRRLLAPPDAKAPGV